eukprot:13537184-Alexandrium_andersonii.AAC.1
MHGKGHNKLRDHLAEIGDQLARQGILVVHGRQMWHNMETAPDGMHLTWELATVFRVVDTLKALANFLTLFCQFYGVPPRSTHQEMFGKNLVQIPVDRRWADYFINCDELFVDREHFAFKHGQMAFRDNFGSLPIPDGRYRPALVPYSKIDTQEATRLLVHQRVYSSCYSRSRELLSKPMGIPPIPKDPKLPGTLARIKSA